MSARPAHTRWSADPRDRAALIEEVHSAQATWTRSSCDARLVRKRHAIDLAALLYSVGAGVYAFRRPGPWPHTFGFHEVFHTLVILAASHFVALAGWIIPSAA